MRLSKDMFIVCQDAHAKKQRNVSMRIQNQNLGMADITGDAQNAKDA